jgi:TrkA domain protein
VVILEFHRLVAQIQLADNGVAYLLDTGAVETPVVRGPPDPELLAAGGQLAHVGAGLHERTDARTALRDGHRTRTLTTTTLHRLGNDVDAPPRPSVSGSTTLTAGEKSTSCWASGMRRAIISAVDVNEVLLPGIGLRYEFTSSEGRRLGIVARHREGDFELVADDRRDPDQSRLLLRLTAEEADMVAEILGAPRIAERFADLTKEVPGLSAGQIRRRPGPGWGDLGLLFRNCRSAAGRPGPAG